MTHARHHFGVRQAKRRPAIRPRKVVTALAVAAARFEAAADLYVLTEDSDENLDALLCCAADLWSAALALLAKEAKQ